jgi:hypothetical protein
MTCHPNTTPGPSHPPTLTQRGTSAVILAVSITIAVFVQAALHCRGNGGHERASDGLRHNRARVRCGTVRISLMR